MDVDYGDLPINMSQTKTERRLDPFRDIPSKKPGDKVAFRARVHHIRPLGTSLYWTHSFLLLHTHAVS